MRPPKYINPNESMINEKTLFILGAGASMPYGFPSASELRESILINSNAVRGMQYINQRTISPDKNITLPDIDSFKDIFSKSSNNSIDYFLSRNDKLMEFGKMCIVHSINKFELISVFNEAIEKENRAFDWYRFLFNFMIKTLREPDSGNNFTQNMVGFLTFNYDRSLENYFYTSLRNTFSQNLNDKDCLRLINELGIEHIYGSVDPSEYLVPYKKKFDYNDITKHMKNISIMTEPNLNSIDIFSQKISKYNRIFFLGFSYDEINLRNIGFWIALHPTHKIYGTTLYMDKRTVNNLKNNIYNTLSRNYPDLVKKEYIEPVFEDVDSCELLKKYL